MGLISAEMLSCREKKKGENEEWKLACCSHHPAGWNRCGAVAEALASVRWSGSRVQGLTRGKPRRSTREGHSVLHGSCWASAAQRSPPEERQAVLQSLPLHVTLELSAALSLFLWSSFYSLSERRTLLHQVAVNGNCETFLCSILEGLLFRPQAFDLHGYQRWWGGNQLY